MKWDFRWDVEMRTNFISFSLKLLSVTMAAFFIEASLKLQKLVWLSWAWFDIQMMKCNIRLYCIKYTSPFYLATLNNVTPKKYVSEIGYVIATFDEQNIFITGDVFANRHFIFKRYFKVINRRCLRLSKQMCDNLDYRRLKIAFTAISRWNES